MSEKFHEFSTRGCRYKPRVNQRNDDVYHHGYCKRDVYNWLKNLKIPGNVPAFDFVEVRLKNSRKDFYRVPPKMELKEGDIVAVEATPGHDIGIVTLTGETARLQMKKKKIDPANPDCKRVYRRARPTDIEKWISAVQNEEAALHKTKKITRELNLEMKLNDVEYQGDGTKATFYYTADERVDFRELIKILAEKFGVRIEMRQIGMRQEASSLGGIGTCGRELCCATWLTEFHSVTTATARIQQLGINPQKLAGQCGKLKCCLNYEYDCYVDALSQFPDTSVILKTKKGEAVFQKADVFKNILWYSYADDSTNIMAIPVDKVKQIIEDNKNNILPDKLEDFAQVKEKKIDFANEEDDVTRFDHVQK